jgi:hypothetical protein
MGHESQIELWSPNLTTFCFVGFGTDRLRRQAAMKTAGKENPQPLRHYTAANRTAGAEARCISAQSGGLESKKTSGHGEVFFLDFPLYRTYRDLMAPHRRNTFSLH